jgi:superfamily II DNA or RNA helicase
MAERQAVIEAATGTGKTMLACAAIADVYQESGRNTRVVIVVPTQVLATQWRSALVESLHLMDSWIGEQHSAATIEWRNSDHPVLITVINTGRNHLNKVLDTWKREGRRTLLIVDECHRAGAATNAKIFEGHFDFSLGLSATPERPDEGEESHVYPNLGKKVFSYSLKSALDEGVLAEFTSVNLYVDFTAEEQRTWDRTTEDLGSAIRHFKHNHPLLSSDSPQFFSQIRTFSEAGDPTARRIEALLASRREVLASSTGRQNCLAQLLPIVCATRKRFIVFHETISAAEATLSQLRELGVPSSIDHSMMKTDQRVSERQRFSRGTSQAMVAVRSLDEGVDVPEAEIAIIASGSRSKRQRIQRMGRVLRHREGKHAICISILVRGTSEETVTGARDVELVGPKRVRHHHHGRNVPLVALEPDSPSGYRPPQNGLRTEVDRLTHRFLLRPQYKGSRVNQKDRDNRN